MGNFWTASSIGKVEIGFAKLYKDREGNLCTEKEQNGNENTGRHADS